MSNNHFTRTKPVQRLVETALMLAIATVLSELSFRGPWPLGGSITIASSLPLVLVTWRWDTRWGLLSALVHGLLQMVLGLSNVQYAQSAFQVFMIVTLDYLIAFGVLGFSAVFKNAFQKELTAILAGIVFTFSLRYLCHFVSGYMVWEALWPNELGWTSALWSLVYNGSFMVPEIIITCTVAALSYTALKPLWQKQFT
jgi:thiamine transporter